MKKDVYLGNGCFGSGKELKHFKYISRKKVGGKWVYEYDYDTHKSDNENATVGTKRTLDRADTRARREKWNNTIQKITAGVEAKNRKATSGAGKIGAFYDIHGRMTNVDTAHDRFDKKEALLRQRHKENIARKSKAALDENNRTGHLQTFDKADKAAEQAKVAEKRAAAETAAKKAKVANIKSASKMQTTGMTDIDKSRAKVDERAANDNRQKVNSPVEKKKLEENNKQKRLLKNLKKAIANARKKKKVQRS